MGPYGPLIVTAAYNSSTIRLLQSLLKTLIVRSPLVGYQVANNMNEVTRERSRMHASIVKSPSVSPQTARYTKRDMQEPGLLNRSSMISS